MATNSLQLFPLRGEIYFPPLVSGLALCLVLIIEIQQEWHWKSSNSKPQKASMLWLLLCLEYWVHHVTELELGCWRMTDHVEENWGTHLMLYYQANHLKTARYRNKVVLDYLATSPSASRFYNRRITVTVFSSCNNPIHKRVQEFPAKLTQTRTQSNWHKE